MTHEPVGNTAIADGAPHTFTFVADVRATKTSKGCVNRMLVKKFDELKHLKDGWFDGQGLAPDINKLEIVIKTFAEYPKQLPMPIVVPTQDGNLLLEWDTQGSPSADIDLTHMTAYFHAFVSGGKDLEADFNLNDEKDFESFLLFLYEHT